MLNREWVGLLMVKYRTYQAMRMTVTMAVAPQWSVDLEGRGRAWNIFNLLRFNLFWFLLPSWLSTSVFGSRCKRAVLFRYATPADFRFTFDFRFCSAETIGLPLGQVLYQLCAWAENGFLSFSFYPSVLSLFPLFGLC